MTAFRSRPALANCLVPGTVVLLSLAGHVWAQSPAPSWPFEEHDPIPTAQPAPLAKSPVQQRLEELYRKDGRPLPDYMQQDASNNQAAPAAPGPSAGDAALQRNQRESAAPQGNVRQQLSNYYQSQGKALPAPGQTTGGGSSVSSAQKTPNRSRQAIASQPAQGHWYDRVNPFHKSTPVARPQSQVQNSAPVSTAANDANHSMPVPRNDVPVLSPAVTATAQAAPPSASSPAAKPVTFWGDLTLRQVPQEPPAGQSQAPFWIDLGPSGKLVPKSAAAKPTAPVATVQSPPATGQGGLVAPAVVAPDVVAPAVPGLPVAPQAVAPAAHDVSAPNAVADDDPTMPFRASSEIEADQNSQDGPYTGLTLEDEQDQLAPPRAEAAKPAPASRGASAADAHHADRQSSEAGHVSLPPSDEPGHVSLPPSIEGQPSGALPGSRAAETAKPDTHHVQTTAEKVQLIAQRVGRRGFKGFCPVVLRDQRELVDANRGYCSVYQGQRYCFSSSEAQARFDAAPPKYAPIAAGMDIVVKANNDQEVEGSLDFALWYKDRLYLFCSPESLQAFSVNPTAYAAVAQRLQ
jgi:YHS domain-containing protein